MQSNGLLIDDSWASLFRTFGINVGISTDGPANVSLPYRAGDGKVARAVRIMQAHGLRPGAIVVATPHNLPVMRDVMSYLADLQMGGFHILPLLACGRFQGLSDAAYRQMLVAGYIQVAETLLARPNYPVETRLALYVSRFVGKPAISINETGCQSIRKPCGRQLIYVDEIGGIYPCQSLHSEALRFGQATAEGIALCPRASLPKTSPLAGCEEIRCALCAANKICTYGCTADNGTEAGQWRCELAQGLYDYLQSDTRRTARLHNILSGSRSDGQPAPVYQDHGA
jgi:radical SAM protein with 4Fe4S-binding SPASM domain